MRKYLFITILFGLTSCTNASDAVNNESNARLDTCIHQKITAGWATNDAEKNCEKNY